jgi:peptidoglycan-N-acetylglucosamine deacetylase
LTRFPFIVHVPFHSVVFLILTEFARAQAVPPATSPAAPPSTPSSAPFAADQRSGRFPWPEGIRCAVSLTFDDARFSQIDSGIPLLDRFGVKATFYVSPDALVERLEGWKRAGANGHEIGNHTLRHPCTGNYAFARNKALEEYTVTRMAEELDSAQAVIQALVGVRPRSFAYPCGQTFVGRGKRVSSIVPLVAERFETGRLWLSEDSNDPLFCDMAQILAVESDGKTFEQLLPAIRQAGEGGRWLVLAGHETAEYGAQTTQLKTLEDMCRYIADPANGILIDTVGNIAAMINRLNRAGEEDGK